MKRFEYKAVAANGEAIAGEMEAADAAAVIDNLQLSGYLPVSANEISTHPLGDGFSLFSGQRMSKRDVHNFTRELATMLDAGLPLAHALATLISLSDKTAVRDVLEQIRANVEAGISLSDALVQSQGPFSDFYISLIRSGEATGALEIVLQRLADYQQRAQALADAVLSALLYPAILMLVAGSSLIVLLIYVVPQFEPLFSDLGRALPLSTQLVVALASAVRNFWWLTPLLLLGGVVGFRALLANPAARRSWDGLLLRLPLAGGLILRIEVARMCRTMGTLTTNGVTLLDAVNLVQETTSNTVLGDALDTIAADLAHGRGLAQPMQDVECFPQLATQLVRVGEETGKLAPMLLKVADIYDAEVQSSIKRMLAILEPALILGMGLLIAFIIISILLAILGLNELVA